MNHDSFSKQMASIAAEAEAQQAAEAKAERRHALYSKLRKVSAVLLLVALAGVAYCYRTQIGQKWDQFQAPSSTSTSTNSDALSKAGDKIKVIQDAATQRDKALDEIIGKK